MGERDMAWPVARPAEEVGVLAMATSERAAPKDRPPLFLEGGIKSDTDQRCDYPERSFEDGSRSTQLDRLAMGLSSQPLWEEAA
jgi:hypothetical protein